MSGFKVFSTGQDLDAIFATRTGTDPSAQLVPFVTPAGQNLSERYYPYNPGDTKAIITRFQFFDTSGNIQDLNDYFRKAPGWSGMGSGTTGTVNEISALDASNVYVGGNFLNALDANGNNVPGTSRIAKWDGTSWSALGSGTNNTVTTIYALNASNVYIGGNFTRTDASYNRIARWNANTSTWSALGSGITNGFVFVIYALDESNVYVGGTFNSVSSVTGTFCIAKWNANTSTWSALGSGPNDGVYTIDSLNASNVYVGGIFTSAGDASYNRIAIWG